MEPQALCWSVACFHTPLIYCFFHCHHHHLLYPPPLSVSLSLFPPLPCIFNFHLVAGEREGRLPAAAVISISLLIFPAPYGAADSSPAGWAETSLAEPESESESEHAAAKACARPRPRARSRVLGPELSFTQPHASVCCPTRQPRCWWHHATYIHATHTWNWLVSDASLFCQHARVGAGGFEGHWRRRGWAELEGARGYQEAQQRGPIRGIDVIARLSLTSALGWASDPEHWVFPSPPCHWLWKAFFNSLAPHVVINLHSLSGVNGVFFVIIVVVVVVVILFYLFFSMARSENLWRHQTWCDVYTAARQRIASWLICSLWAFWLCSFYLVVFFFSPSLFPFTSLNRLQFDVLSMLYANISIYFWAAVFLKPSSHISKSNPSFSEWSQFIWLMPDLILFFFFFKWNIMSGTQKGLSFPLTNRTGLMESPSLKKTLCFKCIWIASVHQRDFLFIRGCAFISKNPCKQLYSGDFGIGNLCRTTERVIRVL